jgi:Ig-like domain from next to BRCA1 gene
MSFARKTLIPLLILTTLLTACGSGVATSTPVDANSISTALVGTLVVSLFQTQTALVPPSPVPTDVPPTPVSPLIFPTSNIPTPTLIYYLPLATLTPNLTPTVTGTVPTPTIDPNSLAVGCNNLAFVRDVTIPSGTVLSPKQDFQKTWKVANTGTCNWMYQYQIMFLSGNAFNGKTTKLLRVVEAGHWAEISVGMSAPNAPGDYTSYWRMADANGNMFGASLAVSFTVKVPKPTSVPATNTPVPSSTLVPSDTPIATDTP